MASDKKAIVELIQPLAPGKQSPSPWSFRSRWALSHHKIPYVSTATSPGLGEPWLRWKTGKWSGRITTPVLILNDGNNGVLFESFDIAVWADDHSQQPSSAKLCPEVKLQVIKEWNGKADTILNYNRGKMFELALQNPAARRRLLPPFLRNLGFITDWLSYQGVAMFASKYKTESTEATLDKAKEALKDLRTALQKSGGKYILGSFSYADIAMVSASGIIKPLTAPYTAIPADSPSQPMQNGGMVEEFGDLVEWRERVLKEHFAEQ